MSIVIKSNVLKYEPIQSNLLEEESDQNLPNEI